MTPEHVSNGSRADLHCHSTASQISKLGVQRTAGLPECATPPEEVYELAKRRGMDFVTITDHDTIGGVLEIADRDDVFISEELTASFTGEPQAVHVLCYGITPDDHEWLQRHSWSVEECAEYLRANQIACALAHPFYTVAAPLEARHRRRLAELFGIWETRNGSRAHDLNRPARVFAETQGLAGVGGSDDHAGVDIGRTFTVTPPAADAGEFLGHLRWAAVAPAGEEGSAAKWAHAAIVIAARTFLDAPEPQHPPAPAVVLGLLERVVSEGRERSGADRPEFSPAEARALLSAWIDALGLANGAALIELMQRDGFKHRDLFRRARAVHDSRLREAAATATDEIARTGSAVGALTALFEACLPVVPYAPAIAFLAGERARLDDSRGRPPRVALVVDAIGAPHGVTHTVERIRELEVPGFDVEVVGTDRGVDRRLPAVAEVSVPYYEGMEVGIPSLPSLIETLADGEYDLIHVASPGPAGAAAALTARIAGVPLVASHHTEFVDYARLRTGNEALAAAMGLAMSLLYRECEMVLSPSVAADLSLERLGVPPDRVARWIRGVDTERFSPDHRTRSLDAKRFDVLYAGRQTREKGIELLAEAFEIAHRHEPRLRLILAGDGPEAGLLRERLGHSAEYLGWLENDELAHAYADADAFLFASQTDTYGQVVVEAQASGLPVVAVAAGGPADLIEHGRSGLLSAPDSRELAAKLIRLAESPSLRARLAGGGLAAARERTWASSLAQLADGYALARVRRGMPRLTSVPAPERAPAAVRLRSDELSGGSPRLRTLNR
jgi:glycosyltransferase involved in cell wall biosynthesis/predicted metal-dependent phosphoesterase TrpH